jgi:DNA (cytosine-5)-methyltransferase 1
MKLEHYSEFDFIWASPPCPTHSRLNTSLHAQGIIRYPDMSLYQEIIFLRQWARDIKWVVENVIPYYRPLIHARVEIERHLFWANFSIPPLKLPDNGLRIGGNLPSEVKGMEEALGIELPSFVKERAKRLMLRDVTLPEIGNHILKAAMDKNRQGVLVK